ncbi:telomeric repeat-binding factor 1 isoform X2 [Syngnathoides biaculeatus]|uniref:telomeric repeat-binding factor 1 isoform X2 n=1 Tax=Syngnathoides biaculeatus TaxID=300417 RepID=UPI002ADD550D|nr:telomeric repeat-binding factor 1 isoform X2 [Syngnathoides biaculeatus]
MEQVSVNSDETKNETEEVLDTSQMTLVASKWILDFLFVGICRRFKEGTYDAFNDAFSTYETVCQTPLLKGGSSKEKTLIGAFLACVMQGKNLDHRFDGDEAMPLMSAARSWFHLKDAVEDESLFDNIRLHLVVQSVAVCLEKGQRAQASKAVKWFEEHFEYPQKLVAKLSMIAEEMDTYHQLFTVFSFTRLLEVVHAFLDAYLAKNPSDFLLNEAVKAAHWPQSIDPTKEEDKVHRAALQTETKPNCELIMNKKLCVSLRRQSLNELLSSRASSSANGEEAVLSRGGGDSQKDDARPECKLHAVKRSHVSGRRLFSNKPSQLDASPDVDGVRQAKTALWNVRCFNMADKSGEITAVAKRKLWSPQTNVREPSTEMTPPMCIRQRRARAAEDSVIGGNKIRRKWSSELDTKLAQGVRRHGKGKWCQILKDSDFEGRTGSMLKDRWRILERSNKADC